MRRSIARVGPLATALLVATAGCGADSGAASGGDPADPNSWRDAIEADGNHYSVVRDNDAARILIADYGPGESSVMHSHPEYCLVLIDRGRWRITTPDGESSELETPPGAFGCEPAGVHGPTNLSSRAARVVVIEPKEGARAGGDDIGGTPAVLADPDHYTILYENGALRISRVSYEAGEMGARHRHPAHCVIWLSVRPAVAGPEPGTVECRLAQTHDAQEAPAATEQILIEFLGRAVA